MQHIYIWIPAPASPAPAYRQRACAGRLLYPALPAPCCFSSSVLATWGPWLARCPARLGAARPLERPGKPLKRVGKAAESTPKVLERPNKTLETSGKALERPGKALETSGKALERPGTTWHGPWAAAGAACGDEETGCFAAYGPFFPWFFLSFPRIMSSRKLITNFDNVAKMDIGPLAQNVLSSTVGNARYSKAKPQTDALAAALPPYLAAASIAHPTPTQTAELAQLRATLNDALSAVAVMANGLYPDDEAALLSSGLSLGKIPERHTTLEAPTKFQLVDGPQAGTLSAKCKRPPHAVALKYLYTLDPTQPDIEWYVVVVRDGDALLTQCKSGDRVYCKVAAVGGDTDQQPFTDVLSRIVQ